MSNPDTRKDASQIQFDYAWKWFSFHADQRLKMFNFMLLVFGIIAAGVVNALGKVPPDAIAFLCFLAVLLAIAFGFLDYRNRKLVWLGEEALVELERTVIFAPSKTIMGRFEKEVDYGLLSRQEKEERRWKASVKFAVKVRAVSHNVFLGKHRAWLPVITAVIAVSFLAAGILVLQHPLTPTK